MTPFNHSTKTQVERAFSNIIKGELTRTTIAQISEQDFKRLGNDLSTILPFENSTAARARIRLEYLFGIEYLTSVKNRRIIESYV